MNDSAESIAAGRIAQVQASASDVVTGEAIAGASQKAALATGAALASKGGWLGLATFAAGVGGAYLGAEIAAATNAAELTAKGLEAVGMHRIGVPTAPATAPGGHNAARMGDAIAHSFALGGFLAAIAVAVAVSVLVVATAGVGAVALIGAAAAGGLVGGFLGAALGGALGSMGARTGVILSGSPNVFINDKPAARMTDMAKCAKEPPPVALVEGNPTVLVNSLPLARIGHKLLCGAVVDEGSPDVFADEATVQCATPEPEIPVTLRVLADWMFFVPLGRVVGGMGKQRASTQSSQTKGANPCGKRTCASDPVDVATGEWIEVRLDLDVPGVLPLQLRRVYASGQSENPVSGMFGPGWSDSFHVSLLRREAGEIEYWDDEGASWVFDTPTETLNAAHLHQPHWRLIGTQQQPILHDRRANQKSHFTWHGQRARLRPEGETTLAYDDYAHCTKLTAPDGRKWQWQYNEAGSLTEAQSPTGSEQFSFDKEGLLQSHQQQGQTTRFDYDDWQRPCLAIAPNGAMTQWAQSRLGRMGHHIDANGSMTRFEYEQGASAPRKGLHLAPVAIIQANGDTQRFEYDQEGLLHKSTNAAGQSQRFEWGPYDLLLAHVDAAGQRYQYQYDHEARLIQVTNPLNQHWQYVFDVAGQLRQERDFAGRVKQYEYSAEGLLTTKIAPDGCATRYQYDGSQRLTQMSSDDCQIRYAYNQAQRLERANVYRAGQLESELIWTYDEAGRVIANVQDEECLSWHYNEHNQCASRSMPMATSSYSFDALGLLTHLHTRHGQLHIERDKLGCDIRRSSLPQTDWQAMVAGSAPFAAHFQLQQQFDSQHRLKAQQLAGQIPALAHKRAEFGMPLRHYRWQQGRLTGIDDPRMGNTRYSLDARDQIARADYDEGNRHLDAHPRTRLNDTLPQQLAQESFTYDAAGDIAMCDEAKPGQLHAPAQVLMQHMRPGGVVRERGRFTYTHDTCGRMVVRIEHQHGFRPRTTHFTWDEFDRLIEVHASDGSRWRYTYDALGRRTGKRCTHAAQKPAYALPSNDLQEERYLWEGARLAQQSKRYADGTQEVFGWHYAPDSFAPLAVSHQKNQDGARLLYVVTDHLGTPRELLAGDGRMVWAAQLQTWGKLNRLWQTPAANDADNPLQLDLRFPNQWHDAESGLHYNYQRYYDPESGQYLSPDPIGMAGGMRSQGYVDNPSVWIDPLGLSECPVIRATDLVDGPHAPNRTNNAVLSRAANSGTPQGRWSSQDAVRAAAKKYDTTKGGVQVIEILAIQLRLFYVHQQVIRRCSAQ